MGIAAQTVPVSVSRAFRVKVLRLLTGGVYSVIQHLAWPAAWLCYNLEISSNQVTCTRFLSPLAFLWLAFDNAPLWMYIVAVTAFGYTDALDGVLAGPRFEDKPHTDDGVILDPLADKTLLISMYLFHYRNFPRLVILTGVGEVMLALLACGYVAVSGNISKMRATMWGKSKMSLEVATAGLMTWYYATHSSGVETATLLVGSLAVFCLAGSLFSKVRAILD